MEERWTEGMDVKYQKEWGISGFGTGFWEK